MRVQGFIVLLLIVSSVACVSLVTQCVNGEAASAQRAKEEQKVKQPLIAEQGRAANRTVDDVPLRQLGGEMIRHHAGNRNVYPIKEVKSLSPTLFWITYRNGYGDEGNFRYDAGINKEKGRWEGGGEFGSFTIQRSNLDHRLWYGRIADDVEMTKHVDDFSVEFQVR